MALRSCFSKAQAPLSMVLVQVFTTGMMVLSKVALSQGMFIYALLTYRNFIGALAIAPFALYKERGMGKKKLSWMAVLLIFLNAMFGLIMGMGLYYYGLRDTTASYSTNFLNTIPVVTFILSVLARVEPLGINNRAGRAKLTGALFCVGGAMVISLYKGPHIHLWPSLVQSSSQMAKDAGATDWVRGTAMLAGSVVSYAVWFILQVKLFKVYPCMYSGTMLTCVAGCAQAAVMGVIIDRDWSVWKLQWNIQLLTIVYSGVFNTAAAYLLMAWVITKRGPTYPSMFNPLSLIFITVVESLFMGQDLTTGSLLGMLLIIGGLYAFLWGKKKEMLELTKDVSLSAVAVVNPEPDAGDDAQGRRTDDHLSDRMPPV